MTSPKKCVVLVTGGSGFLGQHVIGLLQTRAPYVTEIRVIDLPSNPYTDKLDYEATKPVIQFLGSITDTQLLRQACKGVHCVMHIAGVIDVSLFPDIDKLTRVNVIGTSALLGVCKELGVERFIYCSTMDVVCGSNDIINGTETSTSIPDIFFFGGYASTKQKAEELVLAANCESFRTASIRPTTMYGEEDTFTVAEPLMMARKFGRWSRFDCKNTVHQMTYAGNVAWAFLCADKTLMQDHNNITGGKAFFATDGTPVTDIFEFQDPFARACGFSTNTRKIPVWAVLYPLYILFVLMWLVSFVVKVNLRVGFSSFKYMQRTFTFSSEKANKKLGYTPIYSYDQAMKRSIQFYSKRFHIHSKSKRN